MKTIKGNNKHILGLSILIPTGASIQQSNKRGVLVLSNNAK